jgi:hypothetical protein
MEFGPNPTHQYSEKRVVKQVLVQRLHLFERKYIDS